MALTGTLKDFGIAEILQLIGQQAKSGILHLKNKQDEIHIQMSAGNVISAEHAGRKAREKLGSMLVRAGLLEPAQLDLALETQKRSLRRLGDILVEMAMVSQEDLRQMTALQTTETVYRLFNWKSGTYEFEPGEVEYDAATVTPLRAESVLMEGFRQLDEWPMIRRKITSPLTTFERLRDVQPEAEEAAAPEGDEVDAAFASLEGGPAKAMEETASLGQNERRVLELAVPGRTVEEIADRSRLGEFEANKALFNLVNQGALRAVAPARRAGALGLAGSAREWTVPFRRGVARALATVAIAAALAALAYTGIQRGLAWADADRPLHDNAALRLRGRYGLSRLQGALEVYRLERGEYPADLSALVEAGLAAPRDLRRPWAQEYFYRRSPEGGYLLLPPVE
jgi:hypothetical protein